MKDKHYQLTEKELKKVKFVHSLSEFNISLTFYYLVHLKLVHYFFPDSSTFFSVTVL